MSSLLIVVPRTRAYCGRLALLGADGRTRLGPLRVLATTSRRVASKHGNPTCDPLHPFGHTPAGRYVVASTLPPGYAHPRRPARYGYVGAVLLAPISGDARASLANGRQVFALHSGPMDRLNRLRPTRGGLRVSDEDLTSLLRTINATHEEGDSLDAIEILEIPESDVRSVPALDLRGARQASGIPHKSRALGGLGRESAASRGALLFMLGVGVPRIEHRGIDRRELLRAALALVGGLVAGACNQPSTYTPPAYEPGDGFGGGPSVGTGASAGVRDGGGGVSNGCLDDAGPLPDGGDDASDAMNGVPCPSSGYAGGGDNGGYVAGGGVG
jgi:hypothetical protein